MPNRDHDDSYYDRSQVRTERSYDPTDDRGRDYDRRSFDARNRNERGHDTQPGYAQSRYQPTTWRSQGYSQADFERAQQAYAPEWRSYAQDWRDSTEQERTRPVAAQTWRRAEGYAQQRTEHGHQHESVFGDQESIRDDWNRRLGRDHDYPLHSRSDSQQRVQFAPRHDEETLGQQIRHASHVMVNRVKRAFRGPKGYKRSDARIQEDVNERLAQQDQLDPSEIEVSVEGGEVTLKGTVHSRWDKFAAEEMADHVSGVEEVHNQLRVRRADTMANASDSSSTRTASAQAESPLGNRNFRA